MVTGIWFVLRTGYPWRDMPPHYGSWSSIYTRWRRWTASGLWRRLLARLARGAKRVLRHLDCSHIKLPQDGANSPSGQLAQAIGRTKGGLNTKLAAVVDQHGRAVDVVLAPGPHHDLPAVAPLRRCLRRHPGRGRQGLRRRWFPRRSAHAGFQLLYPAETGPPPSGSIPSRLLSAPPPHRIFFARIKIFRRISTRYEKLALTFLAFVQFAAALDWLTHRVRIHALTIWMREAGAIIGKIMVCSSSTAPTGSGPAESPRS